MNGLIVHEWIETIGGSEKVVESLLRLYPTADIFCLWDSAPGRFNHAVTESILARTPLKERKAASLPLMSKVWRQLDTAAYDFVLISSHAFAHHAGKRGPDGKRNTPTFVYTHSPARYLWAPEIDARLRHPAVAAALEPVKAHLRRQDRKFAGNASYAANSAYVADRIWAAWGVKARVIHPPVDVEPLMAGTDWTKRVTIDSEHACLQRLPEVFILGASRFVAYKRLDLVIEFAKAVGVPVVVAGRGGLEPKLRQQLVGAPLGSTIVSDPSDNMLRALMQRACAFVFPAIEDFGIMPVEAMALGTPVIVNEVGGAAESVTLLQGGETFDFEDYSSARVVLDRAMDCRCAHKDLQYFGQASFHDRISEWMQQDMPDPKTVR